MTTFLSSSNVSKTSTITSSRIITSNSIYGVLPVEDTIFKLESTNDYPLIQVSAKATKAMNILVQQSFENIVVSGGGVPSLITTQSFTVTPEDPLDGLTIAQTFYAKITYPFFRIVLINTAGEAGNVYLTTKLAASATSSGGGVANLNPTDDGVKVYGSSNGTTPIVLKTDVTGKLEVEIVGPPSLVTIKGSEDLVFAQDQTTGIMFVTDQVGGLALESTLANIYSSTQLNTYNTTQVIDPFTVTGTFPLVIGAAGAIPNTTVDLYKIQPFDPADEAFYYNSVSVLGTISGITNINTPQICFQYSNDNTTWFGDGLYPTLLLVIALVAFTDIWIMA